MFMKRMLPMLLSAALLTGLLAACGGGSSSTAAPAGDTGAEANGSVQAEDTAQAGDEAPVEATGGRVEFWLDKMADAQKADNLSQAWYQDSGVEVDVMNYPDVAAYQTAMQQSIDNADAPGLFTWWSGPQLETLAKNGKLADLTDEWDYYIADGVAADIKDAFTVDGKVYAAPYSILYNTCLYNVKVFEEAGAEVPTTFDEFLEACEKIKAIGVTPIGLKNDSWASFIWFQQMVAAYDPQLYLDICDGTKPYTDDGLKEVMAIWKDMFDKGYFAEPVLYSDMYKDFATGECAIMLEASPTSNTMQLDYGMEHGTDIGAFVVPSMNGGKSTIFFEASPLCVTEASASKDDAILALRSFYKNGTQTVMVNDNGIANTSTVAVENGTIQSIIDMSGDAANYQLILRFYENTPEDLRNVAIDELARFMYSGADIDDVLETIQLEADKTFS